MIILIIALLFWLILGLASRYLQKVYLSGSNDENLSPSDDFLFGPFALIIVLFAIIDRKN